MRSPEDDEGISLEHLPLADFGAAIARGDLHDAKSIAALAMAQHYLATHPGIDLATEAQGTQSRDKRREGILLSRSPRFSVPSVPPWFTFNL